MAVTDAVVLAEVWRSGVLEGVHRGHAVVLDPDGGVERAWGDPDVRILPRSANKPAQASAMVRAGLPLEGELLALAAASHSGEAFHVEGARRILVRGGLDDTALRTPADLPLDDDVRTQLIARGGIPLPILMNCSGKHAAMLLTCVVNDWSIEDYTSPEHPLQTSCRDELEDLAGERSWATAVDGCGAPLFGLTLRGLARMGAACVQAPLATPPRQVADAMRAHPEWVAGTSRDAAALARSVPGMLIKEGAEAVYVAALPDGRGIALKVEDGANRARPAAMAGVLRAIGIDNATIEAQACAPLLGGGAVVGDIRPGSLT
ncbi:MAG: asparaginase [Actinomycetales bacterium mxb001]|nr:MAG: asparaginase [Actinomycetales bacterium mxb001]